MSRAELDPGLDLLPPEQQIDRISDLFESELKAGRRPDLQSLLDRVSGELRESLLVELVLVGLEYTGTSAYREARHDAIQPEQVSRQHRLAGRNATPQTTSQKSASADRCDARLRGSIPAREIDGYELLDELGRGGMGVVYRARQLNVNRIVALKIIKGSHLEYDDEERRTVLLERFRTEAIAASRLDHENIATVYEIGQFGDDPYYAMRLVDGVSLDKLVRDGPLPPMRAVEYLVPIADALASLHQAGVVHRDLKPSNILIEKGTDSPVLTDFGLAKLVDAQAQVTLTQEGFGSPPYMAPEQLLHANGVTEAADIYSLGATLYHLLTGRPPFQAESLPEFARQIVFCDPVRPRQLNRSIHRDLETICLKCLDKNEPQRYASASELADDLRRFRDHLPIAARPVGSIGQMVRWGRRNPAWMIFAISITALLCLSATIVGAMYARERSVAAVAESALKNNRFTRSNKLFEKSRFGQVGIPFESLPWQIACLELDQGTPREATTRQRLYSILNHGPKLTQVYCHEGPISCGVFSRDGDLILTGSHDATAKIWSTQTGKCLQKLQHAAPLRQVAFNHRGDVAATAADDGYVQLWSVASGDKIGAALKHPGQVRSIVFSASDEFLVTASADEYVRVWRAADGSPHKKIQGTTAGSIISDLALSPDGVHGVSCGGSSRALVWSLRTGEPEPAELHHPAEVISAQFSPSGAEIASGDSGGAARIWDIDSGRLLSEYLHPSAVHHVRFTSDSRRLITATADSANVWSRQAIEPTGETFAHAETTTIAVDPADRSLLTVGDDRTLKLWSLQDGTSPIAWLYHAGDTNGAEFSHDGNSILTVSADGVARVWRCSDSRSHHRIAGLSAVRAVQVTPDGKSVLAWGQAGVSAVFESSAPNDAYSILNHRGESVAMGISPNGQRVAVADRKGEVRVWNRTTDEALPDLPERASTVEALEFSPGNDGIVIGYSDGALVLCDVETASVRKTLEVPGDLVDLAFNPAGDVLLATDSKSARLIQLDSDDNPEILPLQLGGEIIGSRFSPDGRFVVIYGAANRVLLWDTVGGGCKALNTSAPVSDVSFTLNSSMFLTAGEDATARVWRAVDGSALFEPMKYHEPLSRCAFSPDGKYVVLCGQEGTARVLHLASARPVTIRLHHADQIVHAQFVAANRLLTMTTRGDIHTTEIKSTRHRVEHLKELGALYCARVVDSAGALVRLSNREYLRRCRQAQSGATP